MHWTAMYMWMFFNFFREEFMKELYDQMLENINTNKEISEDAKHKIMEEISK